MDCVTTLDACSEVNTGSRQTVQDLSDATSTRVILNNPDPDS